MKLFKTIKKIIPGPTGKPTTASESSARPLVIEIEAHRESPKDEKYRELFSYMRSNPQVEARVFDYFYVRLKPAFDSGIGIN